MARVPPIRAFGLVLSFALLVAAAPSPDTVTVTAAPSIPSNAPQFVDDKTFTSAILNSTNFYRTEHNASWIRWNDTLEEFASDYLDDMDGCDFKHSGGPYGENLAIGCSDASGCVEMWGNEREDYNYKKADFDEKTGHFTQLVWKNTSTVGCGRKLCGTSGWYLVCEYWPRGNVIGAFADQVNKQVNGTGSWGSTVRPPPATGFGIALLALAVWVVL